MEKLVLDSKTTNLIEVHSIHNYVHYHLYPPCDSHESCMYMHHLLNMDRIISLIMNHQGYVPCSIIVMFVLPHSSKHSDKIIGQL